MLRITLGFFFKYLNQRNEPIKPSDSWVRRGWNGQSSWLKEQEYRRENKEQITCPEGWEAQTSQGRVLPVGGSSTVGAEGEMFKHRSLKTRGGSDSSLSSTFPLARDSYPPSMQRSHFSRTNSVFCSLYSAKMLHSLHKGISCYKIVSILISQLQVPVHPFSCIRWTSLLLCLLYLWGFLLHFS